MTRQCRRKLLFPAGKFTGHSVQNKALSFDFGNADLSRRLESRRNELRIRGFRSSCVGVGLFAL